MKVAVITPYFNANEAWLLQCYNSVQQQSWPCTQFMIADGRPQAVVDTLDVQHIRLPHSHRDYGDTPRGIGSVSAISQGFDAIAYLDADNWYYPEHIAAMVALHRESGAAVITANRNLHRLDGSLLGDCYEVDGEKFVDNNCFFLTRAAFGLIHVWWTMKPHHHAIDDRVMWAHIKHHKLSRRHLTVPTVGYRTAFTAHYEYYGEVPPPGAKSGSDILESIEKVRIEQLPRK